ncbi:TIGR00266 family protein [Lacticaseibacillus parakribbianus]|uniref:TIGR00266 family protein n=1 Tax=Lacticaseibacillus parakribbianus TaxID=2970927 RepID=UPI0021CB70DA|nr:TIGR00266 family protein [Lacticaseibacillus parakribbianus]
MDYQLQGSDTFPIAVVHLDQGQAVQIESGAMIYHNGRVALEGRMNSNGKGGLGGLMSAIGRSMTSGESFFITTATATAAAGELAVAPGNPGAIRELTVDDDHQWRLNTGAFLAADATTGYKMERQSVGRALFGGTGGLFVMATHGHGTMLVSAYGDLLALDLAAADDYVVDNNHVVAWASTLDYRIEAASGAFGFTTGEGLVNHFSGSGRVYIQTRNVEALAGLVQPFLPDKSSN